MKISLDFQWHNGHRIIGKFHWGSIWGEKCSGRFVRAKWRLDNMPNDQPLTISMQPASNQLTTSRWPASNQPAISQQPANNPPALFQYFHCYGTSILLYEASRAFKSPSGSSAASVLNQPMKRTAWTPQTSDRDKFHDLIISSSEIKNKLRFEPRLYQSVEIFAVGILMEI